MITICSEKMDEMSECFPPLQALLVCPACKQRLDVQETRCLCRNEACRLDFPIVEGIPILINEQRSIFRIKDYVGKARNPETSKTFRSVLLALVPSITHNWVGARNYAHLAALLECRQGAATVLVVGAGESGEGIDRLLASRNVTIIETDVYFGRGTKVIADGHDLPFEDESVDAVVIQAVLEHVLDPYRCVAEIHRVLKSDGIVYAETPFMYPVHLGPYDFTRFSLGGHRRLFRHFTQIKAGIVGGPGMALAVSVRSLAYSLSTSRVMGAVVTLVLPFFVFWLKYLDFFLIARPHVADYAAGNYFLGAKSDAPVTDLEIIDGHWSRQHARKPSLRSEENSRSL